MFRLFNVLPDFPFTISETMRTYNCKFCIYELPHQLTNDLRLRILRYEEISEKCLNFIEWWPSFQSSCQNENFVNASKKLLKNRYNFSRSALFHMKTRVSLKYFVNGCLWKTFFLLVTDPDPFKLTFFGNFSNSNAFHTVLTKIRAVKLQNRAKIDLTL